MAASPVDFRVLGPFEAVDGGVLQLGGRRRRALLARLVLAGGPVTEAQLLADLFEHPEDATSQRLLRLHLDALAEILGPGRLVPVDEGGEAAVGLVLRAGESDADAFLAEAAAGLEAWRQDDPEGALLLLGGALERWRGDVLEDLLPLAWLHDISAPLVAERVRARTALAEVEAALAAPAPRGSSRNLPAGEVTFLLTDVVESTRRWEEAPAVMDSALVLHDELLEGIVADHGGVLLKHRGEGDSTFSVFARASDAVGAAAAAQRVLPTAPWPEGCSLSVRAGVHTGEAVERDGDYYGPTVNRAARIRSLAQAGWVTISQATAELVRPRLPVGLSLAALGPQALRGIEQPEPIFLLVDAEAPVAVEAIEHGRQAGSWAPVGRRMNIGSAPFSGRATELAELARCLPTTTADATRVALVAGDAGIGKTRFALELAEIAERAGIVTAYGRCDDEVGLPYQPFVAALGELVARAPLAVLDSYARQFGGELARLVPALARRVTWLPPPTPADAETERHLLFDATIGFLALVTRQQPVVLVLDDLHWADRQTLRLLRYVLDAVHPCALLIVLGYRDSEVDPDSPLADVIAGARRSDATTLVALRGLSDDEAAGLVSALTGRAGADATELAQRLAMETGGNPLFTLELLRHLVELQSSGGEHDAGDLANLRLPDTVRAVVDRRVGRLGPQATRVLQNAAVIGREFDLDVLASCLDLDVDEVLDVLDAARLAHLVEETERPGRFTFTHVLVANALVQGRSAAGVERAHLRVAHAIEELHGDGPGPFLPELATHLVAAGAGADASIVATVTKRAGDLALAQLAPDQAAQWYREALPRTSTSGERIDVLIALGTAERQAAVAGHRETLLEAARLARSTGDPGRLAAAALANARGDRSRTYFVDGDRVEMLEAALDAQPAVDSPERARLLAHLALETMHAPDWGLRLARADEALAMARRLDDPTTVADVLILRYETTRLPHTLAARQVETAELVVLAEELGDPLRTAFAHMWRSRAALEAGDIDGLDHHAQEAWVLSAKVRDPYLRWNMTSHWAYRAIMAADLEEAERNAIACLAAGEGEPDARAVFATHLLTIRAAQDRLSELVDAVRADAARRPELAAIEIARSWVEAQLDDVAAAVPTLDRHLADEFQRVRHDNMWLTCMAFAAEAAARCRHVAAADHLTGRLAPWHDQIVWSGSVAMGPVSWLLGLLAITLDRFDEALERLAAARATCERMGAPLWLAQVAVGEATAHRSSGDQVRAAAAAAEARRLATRHGLRSIERDLERSAP